MPDNSKLTFDETNIAKRGISFLDTMGFSVFVGAFALPIVALLSGNFQKNMMDLLVPEIFMFAIGYMWLVSYIIKPITESYSPR